MTMKNQDRYLICLIRTAEDYKEALALVAPYFDNEPEIDSDAGAHFEAMAWRLHTGLGIPAESLIRQPG